MTISLHHVIIKAADLLADGDGDNPEYDRALVELIGGLVGAPPEASSRAAVLAMLRAVRS